MCISSWTHCKRGSEGGSEGGRKRGREEGRVKGGREGGREGGRRKTLMSATYVTYGHVMYVLTLRVCSMCGSAPQCVMYIHQNKL